MELYLIRHGIAQEWGLDIKDEQRSLTKEGRQKTEKVAQKLVKLGLQFDLIVTSPLVRARQTAEILMAEGLSSQLEESSYLAPDGHISSWLVDWLEPRNYSQNTQLALVGHEPNLSNWAEILLWGTEILSGESSARDFSEAKAGLVLKKAGMIGIKLPEVGSPLGRSQMFWLTPPKYLL
jgi:phosphohistidine phosphatase